MNTFRRLAIPGIVCLVVVLLSEVLLRWIIAQPWSLHKMANFSWGAAAIMIGIFDAVRS